MKQKVFFLIYLIVLFACFCAKKNGDKKYETLATIGDQKITRDEFQNRFEFTPKIYHYGKDELNKKHFLASLLHEKLLAQLAREQKLDSSDTIKKMTEQFKKEALVEALFDQEVAKKIQLSDKEVRQGYIRSKQELEIKYFMVSSNEEAVICKDQLTKGEAFENVAALHLFHNPAWTDSVPYKTIKWGETLPEIEDSLFTLKNNEYAGPFKVDNEFFFFKLVNMKSEVFFTEADFNYWRPSIEKRIMRRKRAELFGEFLQEVMRGTRVTVPREKFNHLFEELKIALNIEQTDAEKKITGTQNVAEKDLVTLQDRLRDNLDEPFAIFSDGKTWSYRTIIEKLKYGPYPLNNKSAANLRSSLNRAFRFMFEVEALAEEAKKKNLDQSQYVMEETRMWQDHILASKLRQSIFDTTYHPTEAEFESFYEKNKRYYQAPAMVKIQEILVKDSTLAHQLLNRIKNGGDFARLAKKYSKRELSAQQGGVSGYFTVSALGKVGEAAIRTEIGKLGGPIKTEEKLYSVFKLLDKKDRQPQPYNDIKDEIQNAYQTQQMNKILETFVQSKVPAYDIRINRLLFDSLKAVDQGSGMFVLKQHFPGRAAVPLVNPTDTQKSWYDYILQKLQ